MVGRVRADMTTNSDGAFAQKIAEVLTIPYNDSSVKHALSVLESSGFSDITERTLLNKVETNLLSQVGAILGEFEPMYKGIRELEENINGFKRDLNKINTTIDTIGSSFSPMLRETQMLQKESKNVQSKLDTANSFMQVFVVSDEEAALLTSSGDIDTRFYQVFEKVKGIERNCSALLAESPSLGEMLLADITKLLSAAHGKLKLNIERKLRSEDIRSPQLIRDIQLLSDDPFIFKSVLDQIVEVRKATIKQDFQSKERIDDVPERVVGVECAWIHSVMINEFDLLNSVIGGQNHDSFTFKLFSTTNSTDLVHELLDSILSSIDSLFKQQMNVLISMQTNILDLDPIQNIIQFYLGVFTNHNQKTFTGTFKGLLGSVMSKFKHLSLTTIEKLKQAKKAPADLGPPEFISLVFRLIRKICTSYEDSLNYEPLGDEYIKQKLETLLDPLVSQCYKLSEPLDSYSKQVYLLNCYDAMKLGLTGYVFANSSIKNIDQGIEKTLKALVQEVFEQMRKEPGIKEMEGQELHLHIDEWIENTNIASTKKLEFLRSPSIATTVAEQIHELFSSSA